MAGEMKKVFVNLFTKGQDNFYGDEGGMYYYLFPASPEKQMDGVRYWLLVYDNEADFKTKMEGKERIDAKMIVSIKEKESDKGTWLGGIMFDNDKKESFFVNLYDNNMKSPTKTHDKLLILKQIERREKPIEKRPFEAIETGD